MVLPARPWGNPHLWTCPPVHLLRNAAFLAVETIWVLAWGEIVACGCPSAWGAPADGMDQKDDDNCPNKIW